MPTTEINEETILKRYESLPQDLKEALMGVTTSDAIYNVGKRANLNVEKMGALAEEIGLIILGFVPTENFISDIKKTLEVDEEKAAAIASDVNEKVFLPIRESLKRIHGSVWTEGITKPPMQFGGQRVPEQKQAAPTVTDLPAKASPSTERRPAAARQEFKTQPPPTTTPPREREPMIIKPMGMPVAPRQETIAEEFFKPAPSSTMPTRSVAPAVETHPPREVTTPPAPKPKPPEEKLPPPPPTLPVAEKKPFEINPSSLPNFAKASMDRPAQPLSPPLVQNKIEETKTVVPPPPSAAGSPPKISVPPPTPRPLGIDPYKEPLE